MNTQEFIEKSKLVHGDKYDYSKVNYVNCDTKVCIICPKHGEFWQTPYIHLRSEYGCQKCAQKEEGNKKKSYTQEFIEKSKLIHGDKYDYSKVEYINAATKVCIICPKHGEFWQTPNNHLSGKGCPKCVGKYKTSDIFINESKLIHGDKYDYSKVEYVDAKTKVCIICSKHGEFWQTPNKHLSGEGCPKCKTSILEKKTMSYLEKHNIKYINEYNKDFLGLQRIDFYLPDYNVGIECQGKQHFMFNGYCFNNKKIDNEDNFKNIKLLDFLKYQKCLNNNIKLYYFFDSRFNVEKIIKNNNEHGIYSKTNAFNNLEDLFNKILED